MEIAQAVLRDLQARTMCEAAELMAWRGYDNVRASELARVGRMSVGTLYRHYGSKRGFALAVRAFTEQELCRYVHGAFLWERHKSSSFRDGFLMVWKELTYFAMRQPALFSFTFLHWHPEDMREAKCGAQVRAMLHEVLSEGEREGVLATGSSQVGGALIWGALAELVRARVHGVEVRDENLPASGEALWRALATRADANPRGGGVPPEDAGPGEPASDGDVTSPSTDTLSGSPATASPRELSAHHDADVRGSGVLANQAAAGLAGQAAVGATEVIAGGQPLPGDEQPAAPGARVEPAGQLQRETARHIRGVRRH
jgi:AcrR family transcriptional regulator